jgi:DNA-binding GntR family transcriptional regulator
LGALEAKSVELAAPNMTSDDLNDLAVFNEKMKDCINAKDRASARRIWQEANLEYHRLFAARSGNTELSALVESIRWRTFDFKYVVLFEPYYPLFVEQHEALISSVRSKNFKKAEQLMSNHVKKACEVLLHSLEKIPGR